MGEDEDQGALELPAFDERSTRRSVRRAVARTALTTGIGMLLLLLVLSSASGLWSARGSGRLRYIIGHAYQAVNPGYLINFSAGPRSRLDFGTDLIGNAQALEPGGLSNISSMITIRERFYGAIAEQTLLPPTNIDSLFCCIQRSDTARAPKLIDELPRSVEFSALIELKTPLDEAAFAAFRYRVGICGNQHTGDPARVQEAEARYLRETNACSGGRAAEQTATLAAMVLSPTQQNRLAEHPDRSLDGAHRLTWPDFSLVEFDRWASALRGSDEANMRRLLLPGVDEIKRRAREGKIYGAIVTGLHPDLLRALLEAPELGDITFADVALAIA